MSAHVYFSVCYVDVCVKLKHARKVVKIDVPASMLTPKTLTNIFHRHCIRLEQRTDIALTKVPQCAQSAIAVDEEEASVAQMPVALVVGKDVRFILKDNILVVVIFQVVNPLVACLFSVFCDFFLQRFLLVDVR